MAAVGAVSPSHTGDDAPDGLGNGRGLFVRLARIPILLLSLAAAGAGLATAHEKTDIVVLDNGDRFHGELKGVSEESLSLNTDAAGTISLKWSHVASVVSTYAYEVQATNGERHYGALASPDKAGTLKIVGSSGAVVLALSDVFLLTPIEKGFWDRIDGSINFGFSYTQSNQAVQYSLSADSHYRARGIRGDLQLNSLFNTQEGGDSASQQNLSLYLVRPLEALKEKATVFGVGQLQSNPDQGFDLRSIAGGGGGVFLRETSGSFALVSAGVVVDRENVTGSSRVDTSVAALVGFQFSSYRSDFPKRNVTLILETFPYLTNTPRFRAQLNFKISWEIIHDLTVSLNVLESYDSRPPTEDASKNALSVTTSLGYTF
jgi:hypothetical protein